MSGVLTATMPVPVWAFVLWLVLTWAWTFAMRGMADALRDLFATYREMRGPHSLDEPRP